MYTTLVGITPNEPGTKTIEPEATLLAPEPDNRAQSPGAIVISEPELPPQKNRHRAKITLISAILMACLFGLGVVGWRLVANKSSLVETAHSKVICSFTQKAGNVNACFVQTKNPNNEYKYPMNYKFAMGHSLIEYDAWSHVVSGMIGPIDGGNDEPKPGFDISYDNQTVFTDSKSTGGALLALSPNGRHYLYFINDAGVPLLIIDGKKISMSDTVARDGSDLGFALSNDGQHYAVFTAQEIIRDPNVAYQAPAGYTLGTPLFSNDLAHYIVTATPTSPDRTVAIVYDNSVVAHDFPSPLGVRLSLSPNGEHYIYYDYVHYTDYSGRNGVAQIVVDGKAMKSLASQNPSSAVINDQGRVAIVGGYTDSKMEIGDKTMNIPRVCMKNIDNCPMAFNQDFSHYVINTTDVSVNPNGTVGPGSSWIIDGKAGKPAKSIDYSSSIEQSLQWDGNNLYIYNP